MYRENRLTITDPLVREFAMEAHRQIGHAMIEKLLVGVIKDGKLVRSVIHSTGDLYSVGMDTAGILRLVRDLDGEEVVMAHNHAHPDSSAHPSFGDARALQYLTSELEQEGVKLRAAIVVDWQGQQAQVPLIRRGKCVDFVSAEEGRNFRAGGISMHLPLERTGEVDLERLKYRSKR